MSTTRKALTAVGLAAAAIVLPACSHHATTVSGTPTTTAHHVTSHHEVSSTPTTTPAKMPSSPAPRHTSRSDWMIDFNTTSGLSTDELFRKGAEGAQAYWADQYGISTSFPIKAVSGPVTCPDGSDHSTSMATYCGHGGAPVLVFSPTEVNKVRSDKYPDTSVVVISAHEVGHAVEAALGYNPASDEAYELGAECFAGAYLNGLGVPKDVAGYAFGRSVRMEPKAQAQAHNRAAADGYTSSDPLSTCISYK